MEFDKSKILTAVTADQAEVGQRGWFSNEPSLLMNKIQRRDALREILNIDFDNDYPFQEQPNDGSFACKYRYFYPAPEPIKPTYRPFKNAEEFKPFRDEWFVSKCDNSKSSSVNVQNYSNLGVILLREVTKNDDVVFDLCRWDEFFQWFTRENGDPCGVREEA